MQVELCDFVTGPRAAVAHGAIDPRCHRGLAINLFDAQVTVGERRVAQPESEGEERLPREIEIVVAASGGFVVVVERQLTFSHGKGDRQTRRWIHIAKEHIGDRMSALLAGVPHIHDRIDAIEPRRHRDRTPADERHDHRCASRRDGANQRFLSPGQREHGAIAEFALFQPGHDNGYIALARECGGSGNHRIRGIANARVPHEFHASVSCGLKKLESKLMTACGAQVHGRESHAE